MTSSGSYTSSFSRSQLLIDSVAVTLDAASWPDHLIQKLVHIGLRSENRYISGFSTYGVIPDTSLWTLHFRIEIDWSTHDELLVTHSVIDGHPRRTDGVAPGIVKAAEIFDAHVRNSGLNHEFTWNYSKTLQDNEPAKTLAKARMQLKSSLSDLRPDRPVAGRRSETTSNLEELSYYIETTQE